MASGGSAFSGAGSGGGSGAGGAGSGSLARARASMPSFVHQNDSDRKSTRLNSSHVSISYAVLCLRAPRPPLFPYTTLFRSGERALPREVALQRLFGDRRKDGERRERLLWRWLGRRLRSRRRGLWVIGARPRLHAFLRPPERFRSEEHTSELQSRFDLVCRPLPSRPASSTLSLHDALPIWRARPAERSSSAASLR